MKAEIILHLTDLHFGIERVKPEQGHHRDLCLESLLNTIKKDPDWKPSIICLTGDLVWSGGKQEYEDAKKWLDQLLAVCGLSYDDFVICLGNHEVDRNKLRIARPNNAAVSDSTLNVLEDEPIQEHFIRPFAGFQQFCETAKIPVLNFGGHPSYLLGERQIRGLRFLVLNTAWYAQDENDKGNLWLGLPQLKYMDAKNQAPEIKRFSQQPFTVALMHHPKEMLHEDDQNATVSRPNPIDYLAHRCHILLTGHTHGEVRHPDRIAMKAFHFTGGATYAGSDYRNCFRLLQIREDAIAYLSFEFDPRSAVHKWYKHDAISIPISETVSKPEESSAFSFKDKEAVCDSYLQWLVSCHDQITLRGINHNNTGTVSLPLEQVYIALQADTSNALERKAAQQIVLAEILAAEVNGGIAPHNAERSVWHGAAGAETISISYIMPSIESRDRLNNYDLSRKHLKNLAQAYFDSASLVILGDPGSGKTTLASWLTLVSAKALIAAGESLTVPLSQVDPEALDEEETISLGLTRLPVLVRVADYAEARKNAKESNNPIPSLTEFLGRHGWKGEMPKWHRGHPKAEKPIDPDCINTLIHDALKAGKALIILDGLDEIPHSAMREDIVREVDSFSKDWVRKHQTIFVQGRNQNEIFLQVLNFTADQPGNRLVITSRIAGYHQAPLDNSNAHVTVEPMNLRAVEKFISNWMKAVHQSLTGGNQDSLEAVARNTRQFLEKFNDPHYTGARELATNPLLCSLLATIFFDQGDLPQRRVELYKQAIDRLFDIWLSRGQQGELHEDEMFAILEPIAEYIHGRESTGVVQDTLLENLALQYLAEYYDEGSKPSPKTRKTVKRLMHLVSEDVGLLAERGDKAYGFLHLTFQEYLAARSLLRDPAKAAVRIAEHLSDARWREVIRLALGEASRTHQLMDLVEALLEQQGRLQDLLPQAALTIIAALPDIEHIPDELIETLVQPLIQTYSQQTLLGQLPSRRKLLLSAFHTLINAKYTSSVETCFERALYHAGEQPNQAIAVAELIRQLDFYSENLSDNLLDAICHDSETWHWPIHAALRIGMTPVDAESKLSPPPISLRFKRALLAEPTLVEHIRADTDWLSLIIALYGGIGDFKAADSIDEYHTFAYFLQQEDTARNRFAPVLKERWGGESGDFVYNIAVHLDTVGKKQKESWEVQAKFAPELIFRDSLWTGEILRALEHGQSPKVLQPILQAADEHDNEAQLALWVLNAASNCENNASLKRQIACLQSSLIDATVRSGSFLQAEFETLLESMPPGHGWALFEAAANLVLTHGGLPPADMPNLTNDLKPFWLSELLVRHARGWGDDAVYNSAVFADTIRCSPEELIAAYGYAPITAHQHLDLNMYQWPMTLLPTAASRDHDIPASMLTSIELLPAALGFLRVWSLSERLKPLITATPNILPEVLAASLGDVGQRSGRVDILTIYKPELLQSSSPAQDTLALARAVENPYYRARALCRLLKHLPEQKSCLLSEAEAAADAIKDCFEQSQVLELLIPNQMGEARLHSWTRCRKAVICINNADERARAWARLGLLASPAEAKNCFQQALFSALQISDEFARGTTLRLLAPILRGHKDLAQALSDAASDFEDPILAARALENWGEVLRCSKVYWQHSTVSRDMWVVLALIARTDSENLSQQQTVDALWYQLADTPSPELAQELLNAADTGRLDCTLIAIQSLNWLMESGHTEIAAEVMPKLQAKAAEAIPFLEHLTLSANAAVSASAALLLAEMRGLDGKVIPGVIKALKSEDDLTRLRASELFYGAPQKEPSHRASVIGKAGLDALFSAACETNGSVFIGNAVIWFNERLIYDLSEHIQAWAAELNKYPHAHAAKYALSHIHHFEPQAFEQALHELANGNADVKRAILVGMTHLAKRDRLDEEQWNALNETMDKLDLATLELPKYLVFELQELCAIALEALQSSADVQSQITSARQWLKDRHGKSFADIFRSPLDVRQAELKAFGDMMFTKTANEQKRWSDNASVAGKGVAEVGFIELLCEWLIVALAENINDPDNPNYERVSLLDLLAGAASVAPASYAGCNSLERLEPYLIEVAKGNRAHTGRADAILLLGYYRCLSWKALPALRSVLADVEPVREAAMEAALMFRTIDDDVLQALIGFLHDESYLLALAATQLLTTLGRHDKASSLRRKRIVDALAEAVRDPESNRPVHFDAGLALTPEVPRLNDFFYDALLKVSGYEVDKHEGNK